MKMMYVLPCIETPADAINVLEKNDKSHDKDLLAQLKTFVGGEINDVVLCKIL
jgi:hypothetical protein